MAVDTRRVPLEGLQGSDGYIIVGDTRDEVRDEISRLINSQPLYDNILTHFERPTRQDDGKFRAEGVITNFNKKDGA